MPSKWLARIGSRHNKAAKATVMNTCACKIKAVSPVGSPNESAANISPNWPKLMVTP